MAKKLIVVIMGPGKKHFAEMCLENTKEADKILYWTSDYLMVKSYFQPQEFYKNNKLEIFYNEWDSTDPATNGKCRQRYLEYLKKNYPDDWCLVLDEDEILEEGGITAIKEYINSDPDSTCLSVWMEHFVGDLGHLDNTQQWHFVPHRLFKIADVDKYPEHSHPVLMPKDTNKIGKFISTKIWHLGHLPIEYLDYIKHRYDQHTKDSIIHTQQFLHQWYLSHILGKYPVRETNLLQLPEILCNRYGINKDEFYFQSRGLEVKHFIMAKQWKDYFKNKNVLDCGCGRGPYLCAWNAYDIEAYGFDKSKFAVMHPINANTQMWIDDILTCKINRKFDLVTAIDILEHLEYEQLDRALEKLNSLVSKHVLFSIPFIGDPNLEADPTHIIKETKDWWIDKLSEYFKIKETPNNWLFNEQIIIGEKI